MTAKSVKKTSSSKRTGAGKNTGSQKATTTKKSSGAKKTSAAKKFDVYRVNWTSEEICRIPAAPGTGYTEQDQGSAKNAFSDIHSANAAAKRQYDLMVDECRPNFEEDDKSVDKKSWRVSYRSSKRSGGCVDLRFSLEDLLGCGFNGVHSFHMDVSYRVWVERVPVV